MLQVSKVSKKMKDFSANNITFNLPKGYIMGLIGRNGAGKTTIFKIIMGLKNSDTGTITLNGKTLDEDEEGFKNAIGFVYDELNFPNHLKVRDFRVMCERFYKEFSLNRFQELLNKFNLNEKNRIENLSKGEKIKLMVANALSHNAKLIILDEPTSGLDPVSRKEILALLQEEIEGGDCSILFSTHITSDLDEIADYITFIDNGDIVFTKEMESIKEEYSVIRGSKEELNAVGVEFLNIIEKPYYSEGLFLSGNKYCEKSYIASLEDIICHYTRGEWNV